MLQLALRGMEAAFLLLQPPGDASANHVRDVMGNIKCNNFLTRFNFFPSVSIV